MRAKGSSLLIITLPWLLSAGLTGCATLSEKKATDVDYLTEQACSPGRNVKGIRGSAWLKAASKEASGQFPAEIVVKAPDHLLMEVTNLIGSTEAIIRVDQNQYRIEIPSKKNQKAQDVKGSGTWVESLRWATDLFLGKIPCPSPAALEKATRRVSSEGSLKISLSGVNVHEQFVYHFRTWGGEAWPESLHYESRSVISGSESAPVIMDFKFEDPEEATRSPRRWEAKSARGEVKVRWKDRDVSR